MEVTSIIANIFSLYYSHKITRKERKLALKTISPEMFNSAVFSLMEIKDMDTTQNVILTGFLLDYYNEANEIPMRRLLLQNFHNSHEDIVSLFQSQWNNDTENISVLLKALGRIPEYLHPEDFKYPYIRKIIYAIGAQPQPESLLALEKLVSETNDNKIKELALHQIEKRKELGRWEFENKIK
ncbi:hypothetical protein KRX57_07605 [Weeksellaceae bacterium TAE3-ERU29]|nr:hypothetical protein [Weeksellaceae bacterium TAE3-ERU29]